MRTRITAIVASATTILAFGGCTFGGLADYDITDCRPASTYADDECASLDADKSTCTPYQCDAQTHRCVRKVRDDDHDGDPAAACSPPGTGDCDDKAYGVSSLRVGAPTELAGAKLPADDKVSLSSDGGDAPTLAFASPTTVGTESGECLSVAPADVASKTSLGSCQLLGTNFKLVPTQIDARRIGSSYVAAFVSSSACPTGKLAFTYSDKVAVEATCVGAARPALALVDSANAVVAWYTAPASQRVNPINDCPSAAPAPLRVIQSPVAAPSLGASPVTLSTAATSMQPPAIIVRGGIIFVGSPADDAAKIWALDTSLKVLGQFEIASMPGARSTSIAAQRRGNGTWRLSVVAELGCTAQSIRMALVDFDVAASSFTSVSDIVLAPSSGAFQWQPSVAWVEARQHWLTAWLTTGPKPLARFVADSGAPGAPAFELASQTLGVARALSSGHVALIRSGVGGHVLLDSPVRCP